MLAFLSCRRGTDSGGTAHTLLIYSPIAFTQPGTVHTTEVGTSKGDCVKIRRVKNSGKREGENKLKKNKIMYKDYQGKKHWGKEEGGKNKTAK